MNDLYVTVNHVEEDVSITVEGATEALQAVGMEPTEVVAQDGVWIAFLVNVPWVKKECTIDLVAVVGSLVVTSEATR